MTHYICPGSCHGESDKPVSCGAATCELVGKPLQACDCVDGKHAAGAASPAASPSEEKRSENPSDAQ